MTYAAFKNEWLGRRIDYDHVFSYQCVDLILEYVKERYGLATGVWGNAIDYWYRPTPVLLTKFIKVSGSEAKQGDIVILYGLSGNPYGHIGIAESQTATSITILEQNGATGGGSGTGGDAIRTRAIPKSRVAGLLRPKAAPVPAPAPIVQRTVTLPASVRSWRLYRVGSGLRPDTSDQIATLAPSHSGGLTYRIEGWVGDYAVIIQTQYFGKGVIWVKGTPAIIK